MYYSKTFVKWYHSPGDELDGPNDINQTAKRLMSEIDRLASEYDTVFDLLLDIIAVAANLHRSGKKIRIESSEWEALNNMASSNEYADMLAAQDESHPGYEVMNAEGRVADDGRTGRQEEAQREDGEYVPAGVSYGSGERGRDVHRPAAAPDHPRPVFEGRYERRAPPRGTSVRAIEHGKNKLRISPITREGGTKKSRSSAKADEGEGDHMTMEAKLVKCPGCGAEVSEKSVVCVSCGEFLRK